MTGPGEGGCAPPTRCKLRPLEDVRPPNPAWDAIGAAPNPPYAAGIRRPPIMFGSLQFNRRSILQCGAAFATLKCSTMLALAAPAIAPRLPARANVIIRNAYIMTMEAGTGDIKDGDVHVKDGVIVAVGQKLNVAGAAPINAPGLIVLPRLLENPRHIWNNLLPSMSRAK